MNNNINVEKLMKTLSQMDKKDLEKGLSQLNQMLKSGNSQQVMDSLKNNMNNK